MFELYKDGNDSSRPLLLIIIRSIGEKHPENLADFFPQLCDASLFKPDSLNLRSGILCCVGGVNEVIFMPPKELWEAYSNRTVRPSVSPSVCPSVCPSRFRVRSISPIFFEVGIPNLVCGCILGWRSVAYHFWVTVTLTLTSDLVFRIIVSGAYLLYYLR